MSSIPKRVWLALAASVALNLFFLGLMAGRLAFHRPHPGLDDDGGTRAFLRHSGLRDAGPEVKAILRQRRGEVRDSMRALGAARKRARQALEAEPFDPAQAAQTLRETRELTSQMQAEMHSVLVDVASKLDHAQRQRMAEALWQRHLPR